MPEYNPYAGLLPDYTQDLAAAGAAALPQIAGASPGFFDDMGAIGSAVIGNTLAPALNWIGGQTSGVIREAWGAVEAALHRLTWWVYSMLWGAFHSVVNTPTVISFFDPSVITFLSSHYFLSESIRMVMLVLQVLMNSFASWGADRVRDLLGAAAKGFGTLADWTERVVTVWVPWVRDQIVAGMGYVARGATSLANWTETVVTTWVQWVATQLIAGMGYVARGAKSLADWTEKVVTTWVQWLIDRTKDALGYAVYGATSLAGFVATQVTAGAKWVYDNVGAPVLAELKKIPGYIVAGGQDILGFVVSGLERVLLGPVDAMVNLVSHKLSIPGRMLRGDYADGRALLEDLLDPPPELLKGFTGLLILPFMIASAVYGALGAFGPVYWAGPRQELMRKIAPTLLTPDDVQEAWNRKLISEPTAIDQLRRLGYGGEILNAMQSLRFRLPPLTDLTRMAVREVFSPDQRAALTLDADYPAPLTAHAESIGLAEEWARNYWAAHWDLPSPSQGYEMLHRGIISDAQLLELLRALDYAPVWRNRLRDISYNPLTRVDIRRMYHAGVLSEADVTQAYKFIGYNDENARRLTTFTKLNYAPGDKVKAITDRELTATQIRTAYRRRVITREDAADRLITIGYDAEEAEFQLALDDSTLAANPLTEAGAPVRELTVATVRQAYREGLYEYDQATAELEALGYLAAEADVMLALDDVAAARDLTNAEIALIRERYIGRRVDGTGARGELAAIGLAPRRQTLLLAEWAAEAERGTRRLTVIEIFKAAKAKLITPQDAYSRLLVLGYTDDDANIIFDMRGPIE